MCEDFEQEEEEIAEIWGGVQELPRHRHLQSSWPQTLDHSSGSLHWVSPSLSLSSLSKLSKIAVTNSFPTIKVMEAALHTNKQASAEEENNNGKYKKINEISHK